MWSEVDHQVLVLGFLGGRGKLYCRPSSEAAHALRGATWYGLHMDLQMIAACVRLRGTWERLSCEPRLAATNARFGAM